MTDKLPHSGGTYLRDQSGDPKLVERKSQDPKAPGSPKAKPAKKGA